VAGPHGAVEVEHNANAVRQAGMPEERLEAREGTVKMQLAHHHVDLGNEVVCRDLQGRKRVERLAEAPFGSPAIEAVSHTEGNREAHGSFLVLLVVE
jgi:hypothetical protein